MKSEIWKQKICQFFTRSERFILHTLNDPFIQASDQVKVQV
jgi:hypothetical protein